MIIWNCGKVRVLGGSTCSASEIGKHNSESKETYRWRSCYPMTWYWARGLFLHVAPGLTSSWSACKKILQLFSLCSHFSNELIFFLECYFVWHIPTLLSNDIRGSRHHYVSKEVSKKNWLPTPKFPNLDKQWKVGHFKNSVQIIAYVVIMYKRIVTIK